jgi:hypothetical protein
MRQLRQQLSTNSGPHLLGTDPQLAASHAPTTAQLHPKQLARGAGGPSMLDKARHIRADGERRGTRLTGRTLAPLLGISDGYARRLLRELGSDSAVKT